MKRLYKLIINYNCILRKIYTFVMKYESPARSLEMQRPINYKKIVQALDYLAQLEPDKKMNKMKAYKLLCLADKYHIRQYGRSITNDNYFAMTYGTVPSTTKDLLDGVINNDLFDEYIEQVDQHTYKSKKEANLKVFSETDLSSINLIYNTFKDKDQFELSSHSHLFPEWTRFQKKLKNPKEKNSFKIKKDDFFINTDDGTGLFVDDDELLSLTKELFNRN